MSFVSSIKKWTAMVPLSCASLLLSSEEVAAQKKENPAPFLSVLKQTDISVSMGPIGSLYKKPQKDYWRCVFRSSLTGDELLLGGAIPDSKGFFDYEDVEQATYDQGISSQEKELIKKANEMVGGDFMQVYQNLDEDVYGVEVYRQSFRPELSESGHYGVFAHTPFEFKKGFSVETTIGAFINSYESMTACVGVGVHKNISENLAVGADLKMMYGYPEELSATLGETKLLPMATVSMAYMFRNNIALCYETGQGYHALSFRFDAPFSK